MLYRSAKDDLIYLAFYKTFFIRLAYFSYDGGIENNFITFK